jgi:hypothetical protein
MNIATKINMENGIKKYILNKVNPYEIGINFYIILIIYVVTFIGCDIYEKYQDKKYIKRTAQQILETPNLIQNEKLNK